MEHRAEDHAIAGSPYEVMRAVLARHLCGLVCGRVAPVEHFLVDAGRILDEAHQEGVRFHIQKGGLINPSAGFVAVNDNVSAG